METFATEDIDIRDPRFSPDGKSIVFDRCSPDYPDHCRIHIYDLEAGTLGYFQPPVGQTWMQAYFSDQGDKIVFVTMPTVDRSRDLFSQREIFLNTQIAVMNRDGSNMRSLTNIRAYKGMPAFSHSGKKIIFTQAEKLRDSGKSLASSWDLWEVDLETGTIRLFAGPFQFYQMGLSTYFPDDRKVLVNGDMPASQLNALGLNSFEYGRRYNHNSVFEVSEGQAVLGPPLTTYASTRHASMDRHGAMFMEADGGPQEGLRIRRFVKGKEAQSWNFPRASYGWGAAVSMDGNRLVMSITPMDKKRTQRELAMLDTSSGKWRNLDLPSEAKQINR